MVLELELEPELVGMLQMVGPLRLGLAVGVRFLAGELHSNQVAVHTAMEMGMARWCAVWREEEQWATVALVVLVEDIQLLGSREEGGVHSKQLGRGQRDMGKGKPSVDAMRPLGPE